MCVCECMFFVSLVKTLRFRLLYCSRKIRFSSQTTSSSTNFYEYISSFYEERRECEPKVKLLRNEFNANGGTSFIVSQH